MRKIAHLEVTLSSKSILTVRQMSHIKGGDSGNTTDDDKRRERPGGGVTTH